MSGVRQRPEHLLIREYLYSLRDAKRITREGLRDAFVSVYLEMIPPGEDAPHFEAVHRHDTPEQMRRKDEANLKKLWRAIDGTTFFPLAFKGPLVVALDNCGAGMGEALQKLLLHNCGLLHLPIHTQDKAPVQYAEWLREFSEANSAIVADLGRNGKLDSDTTRKEVLDVIEASVSVLRELERNMSTAL